jgi:hypothetical protein
MTRGRVFALLLVAASAVSCSQEQQTDETDSSSRSSTSDTQSESDTATQTESDTPPDTESSTDSCFGLPDFTPCQVVTEPDRDYDICSNGICVSPGCGDPSCNAPGVRYPLIPDEGHTDYSRTTDEEPIVIDNFIGLTWQGCQAGRGGALCEEGEEQPMTWTEAIAYCDAFVYAGYDDWRLPDRYEGSTRGGIGEDTVGIDSDVFPDSWAGPIQPTYYQYWSSSRDAYQITDESQPRRAWVFRASLAEPCDIDAPRRVQCVRGGEALSGPRFERSTDNEPVVYDTVTGLTWMGCPLGLSGTTCEQGQIYVEFDAVVAYQICSNSHWAGYDDWVLPDARALFSITDDRNDYPGSRQDGFTLDVYDAFFTSTRGTDWVGFGNGYYMVVFGPSIINDLTGLGAILCVRAYE